MRVPLEEGKGVSSNPPTILGFRNFRATGGGPSPKHESMRAVLHHACLCGALWSATSRSPSQCVRHRFFLLCVMVGVGVLEITVACVILPTRHVCSCGCPCVQGYAIQVWCSHIPVV